jgi:hypothetical protein
MPVVNPLPKEKASPEVHDLYDKLTKTNGFMPAFFGTMAHRPAVFKSFLARAAINQGTVDLSKELPTENNQDRGCEYYPRTTASREPWDADEQLAAIDLQRSQFDERTNHACSCGRVTRGASERGVRSGLVNALQRTDRGVDSGLCMLETSRIDSTMRCGATNLGV